MFQMEKQPVCDLDFVDDLYFSAILADEEEAKPQPLQNQELALQVSDAKYAQGLQFQEALMGSITISQCQKTNNNSSILMIEPPPATNSIKIESGESSKTFCEICAERKDTNEMFHTDSCVHNFCSNCVTKHVEIRIQNSRNVITCPELNCKTVLELDFCRSKLSKGVIDLWEEALCEEMISKEQRFYCPFKDCSAMLVNDNEGGEVIRESECPFCHRLFCAQCYVPWHSGVDCEEFQRLNEDERGREDLMVMELARDKKWRRCPRCKFYVERSEGCPHMTCRCSFQFCYGCGAEWTPTHGGCQGN